MNVYSSCYLVLFVLWACLLYRCSAIPLVASEPTGRAPSSRPSREFPILNQTNPSNDESRLKFAQNQEVENGDVTGEAVMQNHVNEHLKRLKSVTKNAADKTNANAQSKANIVEVDSNKGPYIVKGENESNIYVLADVLDMDKGLYYIPANKSDNSTEGWVFWKIPHLYNLANPSSSTPHDVTTQNVESDSNHGFYVLMLGLGCFVCGLMVMLILTLVILTRRFSNRTRPPARTFGNDLVVEANPDAPKYVERFQPPYFCENMDYYAIPYGPGVPRLRRFSSDDALDILRRRAEPALPPHYCACQRCYFNDVILASRDDDVPLLDLNDEANDFICDNISPSRWHSENGVNETNNLIDLRDTNQGVEEFLLTTRTGNKPIDEDATKQNDVSIIAPICTDSERSVVLSKHSQNVKDRVVNISPCDKRYHSMTSQSDVNNGRYLGETLHWRGEDAMHLRTIDAIPCSVHNISHNPSRNAEKQTNDVTNSQDNNSVFSDHNTRSENKLFFQETQDKSPKISHKTSSQLAP